MILAMMIGASLAAADSGPKPGSPPRANLARYFTADDYPPNALASGAEGVVAFRLQISADGRVTKCSVTRSAGDPALDAATCSILLGRARYEPARDASGQAVPGTDDGRVTWRLPPSAAPEPFAALHAPVLLELTIGAAADGRPICSAVLNGGPGGADGDALCGFITGPAGGDVLQDFPRDSAITATVAIGLDGDALPPATNADRGEIFMDSAARLTVGADGRVTDCRMISTNVHGELGPMPEVSLCNFPSFRTPMFPSATEGSPPRSGTIRFEFHIRQGATRRAA